MKAYLGPLGNMVALPYVTSEQLLSARAATERTTLGGAVRLQTARAQRRTWQVTIGSLRPDELGELAELLFVGRPPWVWIDPWMRVTNMLTPAQSMLAEGSFGGSGQLLGRQDLGQGVSARWHLRPDGWVDIGARTPVETGVPVSASAWVTGKRVTACLVWQHEDGRYEESRAALSTSGSRPKRLTVVASPRSTARSVALRIKGAETITRPAITWTPRPVQWHLGQGCSSAVVLDMPQDILAAYTDPTLLRSANTSFTVQEVG